MLNLVLFGSVFADRSFCGLRHRAEKWDGFGFDIERAPIMIDHREAIELDQNRSRGQICYNLRRWVIDPHFAQSAEDVGTSNEYVPPREPKQSESRTLSAISRIVI